MTQKKRPARGGTGTKKPAARVSPKHGNVHAGRHSRKKKKNRVLIPVLALCALTIALGVFAVSFIIRGTRHNQEAEALAVTYSTLVPEATEAAQVLPLPTAAPTAEPMPRPTAEPTMEPTAEPTAAPTLFAYLPVVYRAETKAKRIAITVDDCYQLENLKEIIKLAVKNKGRLTLFPIGENIAKHDMPEILQACVYKLGFEIENHTWSHQRVFRLSEMEMAEEIWKQRRALNQALQANYQEHFFRLMGGDGVGDQRIHNYLSQLGFLGIAGWSYSGSDAPLEDIKSTLAPGMIYLFHTTDPDTKKLREFIPWVRAQGYEMVTLNELLGLESNALSALTDDPMPEPRAFVTDYHTQKKGDYAWIVVQMQDRLREAGYLKMDGPSTGYYGAQTAKAVAAFQEANGLSVTGEADEATQKAILGIEG